MIKKILISFFLLIFLTSCGKKGDPTFNGEDKNFKNNKIKVFS
tara:strand:- start:233 stop:361 length:129 start_codon:yes stop_codon:yes gene_type:complete